MKNPKFSTLAINHVLNLALWGDFCALSGILVLAGGVYLVATTPEPSAVDKIRRAALPCDLRQDRSGCVAARVWRSARHASLS